MWDYLSGICFETTCDRRSKSKIYTQKADCA